jgi:hypothetical protein
MGQLARQWPEPPMLLPDYYLRLTVAPAIRRNLSALEGFGSYWERVRFVLPKHMMRLQIIELKLCLLSAWISKYGER